MGWNVGKRVEFPEEQVDAGKIVLRLMFNSRGFLIENFLGMYQQTYLDFHINQVPWEITFCGRDFTGILRG